MKALIRSEELLGLTREQVASILHLSSDSLDLYASGEVALSEGSTEWQCALTLVDLYGRLSGLLRGDERQIQLWMRSFNAAFLATPIDLILRPEGLSQVLEYLRQASDSALGS
jgi:hypothetical protein